MAKWSPPNFNRWFAISCAEDVHREWSAGGEGVSYDQVINFDGSSYFVVRGGRTLYYINAANRTLDDQPYYSFDEPIVDMVAFQMGRKGPQMVIVVLQTGSRHRVLLNDTELTPFDLQGPAGLCYCPGDFDDHKVVFCLHQNHIEVISTLGEILAARDLPGYVSSQTTPATMRYTNSEELEVKWDFDKLVMVFDPYTLRCWRRERFSNYFLDAKHGQILFQKDFRTLAVRRSQEEGDVEEYDMAERCGLVEKASFQNNNYYAVVLTKRAVQIFDLHSSVHRWIEIEGCSLSDCAFNNDYAVVTHNNGFTCFKI
jgi:hypothetical protein